MLFVYLFISLPYASTEAGTVGPFEVAAARTQSHLTLSMNYIWLCYVLAIIIIFFFVDVVSCIFTLHSRGQSCSYVTPPLGSLCIGFVNVYFKYKLRVIIIRVHWLHSVNGEGIKARIVSIISQHSLGVNKYLMNRQSLFSTRRFLLRCNVNRCNRGHFLMT
jgi:hypothetical protein